MIDALRFMLYDIKYVNHVFIVFNLKPSNQSCKLVSIKVGTRHQVIVISVTAQSIYASNVQIMIYVIFINSGQVEIYHWSDWGVWSECSVSCGKGNAFRRRVCPRYGGGCGGPFLAKRKCERNPCEGKKNNECCHRLQEV